MRNASCKRVTGETDISMELNLDGTGCAAVATGHAFFDHMLDLLARNSLLVPQGVLDAFPQNYSYVLHRVVGVHLQVAAGLEGQVHQGMASQQIQHVVAPHGMEQPDSFQSRRSHLERHGAGAVLLLCALLLSAAGG